jgi:hypothetical protein
MLGRDETGRYRVRIVMAELTSTEANYRRNHSD